MDLSEYALTRSRSATRSAHNSRDRSSRTKGTVKGIKNMYLAGQWTMAPGGLPVAAVSGKFSVQRILKSEHKDIKVD